MGSSVQLHTEGGFLARLVLDRPDSLNAFDAKLLTDLSQAFDHAEKDEGVKVISIQGAGRAFSAGADIRGGLAVKGAEYLPTLMSISGILERVRLSRLPVIAQVHGYCLGLGLELALSCDFILAAEDALLGEPEINLGLAYGATRLSRSVGERRALELSLTGRYVNGKEAAAIGLANAAFPQKALDGAVLDLGKTLAKKPAFALMLAKLAIKQSLHLDATTASIMEALSESLATTTQDVEEGMKAFSEKRQPRFRQKLPRTP